MPTSNVEFPTLSVEAQACRSLLTSTFNVRRSKFDVRVFIILAVTYCSAAFAVPTTRPATTSVAQPTAGNLEVHEWSVFVLDAATGQINTQGMVSSTLPGFIKDHRFGSSTYADSPPVVNNNNGLVFNGRFAMRSDQATTPTARPELAESDQPSPVGVIRLIGSADSKVDVSITAKSGAFLGSWPKAEDRSGQLLWRDLSVSDHTDDQPPLVGITHWFTELRSVTSAYLNLAHGGTDRFLMYDLEMPYAAPLKAKTGSDFSVEISNPSAAPLHDLTLYQGDTNGWRTVSIGDFAPAAASISTTGPTTAPAKRIDGALRLGVSVTDVSGDPSRAKNFGYQGAKGLFVDAVLPGAAADGKLKPADIVIEIDGKEAGNAKDFGSQLGSPSARLKIFRAGKTVDVEIAFPALATAPAVPAAAPSQPATPPAIATTLPAGKSYHLVAAPSTQPSDLAEAWKPVMARSAVDPIDRAVIARVIARYAFDPHRLTAVYRMDDAEFDRLLPIEIVPQPAKIKRFGLMIVINLDLSAGSIVDDLIKQLGDDDWSRRDSAFHALASMGPAATAKLQAAKTNTDLEIAWRAERLLSLVPQATK